MPLQHIISEEQRLDKLSLDLRAAADEADLALQHVYSSHLVLVSAGHVEKSVLHVLSEYGRVNGNSAIKRFVEKTVARNNSLNCEKIKKISDQFKLEWWPQIEAETSEGQRDSVDSLKTLRDQIAHGHKNGTGFSTIDGYFKNAKDFIRIFSRVILGY